MIKEIKYKKLCKKALTMLIIGDIVLLVLKKRGQQKRTLKIKQ